MSITVSAEAARKDLADLVNRVAYGAESVILTRRGQEIAALVSVRELELLRQIEDQIDIEDAEKALAEPEANIKDEEFWQQLGL